MTNIPNIYYKFGSIIKVNLCFTNQNCNKYFVTTGNIKLKSFIKRMKTVINNYKVTKTFSEEHSKLITISKRKFSTKVVIRLKLWLLICSKIQPILLYAKEMNYRFLGNDFFYVQQKIFIFNKWSLYVQQLIFIVSKWLLYVQQMIFIFSKWLLHSTRNLDVQQSKICVQ